MPNTYTQLLVQLVFAVKFRQHAVTPELRIPLEKYMTGIVTNNGHKLLAIYCMPDHCHILVGLNSKQSISDLVRDIKSNSSKWVNEERQLPAKFKWQEGFGAFSYATSEMKAVVKYILNQEEHHRKKTFKEEYQEFLERFSIEHDEKYLFDFKD